jgi:hypothetical protein
MKRFHAAVAALLVVALTAFGCAHYDSAGWVTLIDGEKGLENFDRIGDANWRAERGAIVADAGKGGHLVSKRSYSNFILRAEFWAATDTNSGIFFRASNPKSIGSASAYEANIWDIRPDPRYGTGAIVDFASVPVPLVHKAGGRWNTMEITAQGPEITVVFNGHVTAHIRDTTYKSGPFSLQYGPGVKGVTGGPIKWRKVQIKEL